MGQAMLNAWGGVMAFLALFEKYSQAPTRLNALDGVQNERSLVQFPTEGLFRVRHAVSLLGTWETSGHRFCWSAANAQSLDDAVNNLSLQFRFS